MALPDNKETETSNISEQTVNKSDNAVKPIGAKVKTKTSKKPMKKQIIPRGQPKSGRPWKEPKQKFSNIKKSIYRLSKHKKDEFRSDIKHIKELSKTIKDERKQENEYKRQRREENAKKKLENERKSEIVQIIKNPAKLKRMKKKALRKIEKRDLANMKVV